MKIDELISELERVREEHGNLEVKFQTLNPENFVYGKSNQIKWEKDLYEDPPQIMISLFVDTEKETPKNCIDRIDEVKCFTRY